MFLWPASAAATASEMAALLARSLTALAVGAENGAAPEPAWVTPHSIALELQSVRLRDFTTGERDRPVLLCAPFALHGAAIVDLAPGHSLVAALRRAGLQHLFVTDWRSATAPMRLRAIDDYLADLNVLVDHIGTPVDLIGLCQGGWMATIYAARFPAKVRKLVLAGAPIDTAAASSALSALADASPLVMFHELVRLGDGLLPGRKIMKFWGPQTVADAEIRQLLQTPEPVGSAAFGALRALFQNWYSWTVDLPGPFFLETVEKIYQRNELATGRFVALGQRIDLATITAPLFLLAARDDELVAPAQLFAAERLVGTEAGDFGKATAACRHAGLFVGKNVLEDIWPQIVRWMDRAATMRPLRAEARVVAERMH